MFSTSPPFQHSWFKWSESLWSLSQTWWWSDHLTEVSWRRETSKTYRMVALKDQRLWPLFDTILWRARSGFTFRWWVLLNSLSWLEHEGLQFVFVFLRGCYYTSYSLVVFFYFIFFCLAVLISNSRSFPVIWLALESTLSLSVLFPCGYHVDKRGAFSFPTDILPLFYLFIFFTAICQPMSRRVKQNLLVMRQDNRLICWKYQKRAIDRDKFCSLSIY